jgi:hypothetical protein
MCFNGPKSWQLGWYSDYHVDLSTNNYNWIGDLVGFAQKDTANTSDKMIIRIQDANSNKDIYVHFNRKIGFNSETKEGADQVLVSTRTSGVGYAQSDLVAKLNTAGVYTINDIGGSGASVRINVNSINTSRANISIQLVPQSTPVPIDPPTAAPVDPPTTAAPSGGCNSGEKDGICQAGENCENCPEDCKGRDNDRHNFCCVGGTCESKWCNRRDWKCEF